MVKWIYKVGLEQITSHSHEWDKLWISDLHCNAKQKLLCSTFLVHKVLQNKNTCSTVAAHWFGDSIFNWLVMNSKLGPPTEVQAAKLRYQPHYMYGVLVYIFYYKACKNLSYNNIIKRQNKIIWIEEMINQYSFSVFWHALGMFCY